MTGKQHAVMWMGLLLIVLRLFTTSQWAQLKTVFQSGQTSASGSGTPSSGSPSSLFGNLANPLTALDPFHNVISGVQKGWTSFISGGRTYLRGPNGQVIPASQLARHRLPPGSTAHGG